MTRTFTNRSWQFLALLLSVTFAVTALPPTPASAASTATIEGVVSWPTGAMHAGAMPHVQAGSTSQPGHSETVAVAADGHYRITNVPAGEYLVQFGEDIEIYHTQFYGGTNHEVVVGAGTATTINFDATYTGSISGKVTDPQSETGNLTNSLYVAL